MIGIVLAKTVQERVSEACGNILRNGIEYSEPLAQIGKGLAALFLLIVAIYYITSILDGGKFQVKMLIPLFIFIFVCNFKWVTAPVTGFIGELSTSAQNACSEKKSAKLEEFGLGPGRNPDDVIRSKQNPDANAAGRLTGNTSNDSESGEDSGGVLSGMGARAFKRGVIQAGNSATSAMIDQLGNEGPGDVSDNAELNRDKKRNPSDFTAKSIISLIISFVADLLRMVMSLFGALLTSIIIAFGPITWAFAVIPGQAGTIKTWFIRLCQFSLWAPIVALVDSLSFTFFSDLYGSGEPVAAFLMSIVVGLLNLCVLTQVPSIASMIIEGASGAISLSQGLTAVGAVAGKIGGALAKGGKGIAGGLGGFLGKATQKDASGHKAGFGGALKQTMIDGHRTNKDAYKKAGRNFKG